jgi:hypothetical protein
MPKRIVFEDENNNELDCFINTHGEVYLSVGDRDEPAQSGFITLNKQDVAEFIEMLQGYHNEMPNEPINKESK